jgi:hypothetical protein
LQEREQETSELRKPLACCLSESRGKQVFR